MSNRDAYHSFCREIPDLPLFLEPWYLDAVQDRESWDAALVQEKDQIVAALPYFTKRQKGFRTIVQPVFAKFLGPVLRADRNTLIDQHRLYGKLIGQLPTVDCFKQNFHPAVTNWLPFYWAGYRQTTRYTYRLAVEDMDQVQAGISRNQRRGIKRAGRQLHLLHDLPPEAFYQVNKMSFDRQKLAVPYSLDQFLRHDRALSDHGARQLFFAVDDQQRVHSVAYLIWDRQRAYFHLAGNDPALQKSGGGFWLIWKCIEYTHRELGLREFDFEGSMIPRIESVRRQFGARQVPYFFVWKYHSSLYRLLEYLKGAIGR